MTIEKAIEFGKIFLKSIENEKGSATYEFVEMAVKMMEKEPCEDAISRQAVDTLIDELARAISDERCYLPQRGRDTGAIMQNILDLPSVTPQPKTGHWIKEWNIDHFEQVCSECGCGEHFKSNYCPNCGRRMLEGSDEK